MDTTIFDRIEALTYAKCHAERRCADLERALRGAKTIIAMMELPAGLGDVATAALNRRMAEIDAILATTKEKTDV